MREPEADQWSQSWSRLMGIATAFRYSCVLFAAVELRLFEAIAERGSSVAEVAEATALDAVAARCLLNALVAVEILHVDEGRYRIEASFRPFLLSHMIPDLKRVARENQAWLQAAKILQGSANAPLDYRRELLDGRIADYPTLLQFNRRAAAEVLNMAEEVRGASRVLDVGGGDGIFADLLLQMNPGASVSVLELEGGAQPCVARLASELASGRLRIIYDDARRFVTSEQYDLVIINELLEMYGEDDKIAIARSAVRALAPYGRILLVKFALDAGGVVPPSAALFSVRMYLKCGSYLESDAQAIAMLLEAGCRRAEILPGISMKSVILASR